MPPPSRDTSAGPPATGSFWCPSRRRRTIHIMRTLTRGPGPLKGIPLLMAGMSHAGWGTLLHDLELSQPSQPLLLDQTSWTRRVLGGSQAATLPGQLPQPRTREGLRPGGAVVGHPQGHQGASPATRIGGDAPRHVQPGAGHFAAQGAQSRTGPPFDQGPANVKPPLGTGQNAGATPSVSLRRKRPTACPTWSGAGTLASTWARSLPQACAEPCACSR